MTATYTAGPESSPEEVEAAFAAIDPRVGGSYTIRWDTLTGSEYEATYPFSHIADTDGEGTILLVAGYDLDGVDIINTYDLNDTIDKGATLIVKVYG